MRGLTRHALVVSGQGKQHLAEQAGPAWLGACGSVITRAQAVTPYSTEQVAAGDVSCFYCRAIAAAVEHQRVLAEEAIADAETYWTGRMAEHRGMEVAS